NIYIDEKVILRKYDASLNDLMKYGVKNGDAIFTASSEKPEEIAFSTVYLNDKKAIFNGFSKRFRFDQKILNPKYASYLFRSQIFRNQAKCFATGYTRFNISQKDMANIKLNIPSQTKQKEIIDIIEPIEIMINATQEINKKLYSICSYNTKEKLLENIISSNNGFNYSKKHKSKRGLYNIFTIKNININKSDKTNFIKNNLLYQGDVITGLSGTIGTAKVISEDNWVSNQRTLSLRTKFPLQIMKLITTSKRYLNTIATGAVQKNIKASDILNLKFSITNKEMEKLLSSLYIKNEKLINNLSNLKNKLLKLLIK
ncbi:MAG: restriction endonuclease subunit S, partial [Mycoplasmatales bacterium]|nr:restriction endonuclease subunit S [Mycoplasmatales bacterium]